MTSEPIDLRGALGGPFDDVNRRVLQQTTALLGSTIAFTPENWAEPAGVPGWTKAHVAGHLVQDALRSRHVVARIAQWRGPDDLGTDDERRDELEAITASGPLDLQIALDTSAGQAAQALHDLPAALRDQTVHLPGITTTIALLPLARLSEVVVHHLDLVDGFTLNDIDDETALWCLEWRASLLVGRRDLPATRVIAEEGFDLTIGRPGSPTIARADVRTLLGWVTGRGEAPPDARWREIPLH